MVKGCGRKCSKVTMNIFNVIILLLGLAIIAVSGWALGNNGALPGGWSDSGIVDSGYVIPESLIWAVLALGILAVLVPILGFCAACGKKKHCFSLTIFAVLVMLIGLAILIIGVFIYLFGTWGRSLTTCAEATQNPAGNLDLCSPPTFYSQGFTQSLLSVYNECEFGEAAPACTGNSESAQLCLGIYTAIIEPGSSSCSQTSYDDFFTKTVDYVSPWSFTVGVVVIALGGVIFLMSIPAICLCCAPSKSTREKEEVQEEAQARRAAAAGQQQSGSPVQGNTRYV